MFFLRTRVKTNHVLIAVADFENFSRGGRGGQINFFFCKISIVTNDSIELKLYNFVKKIKNSWLTYYFSIFVV